jgi:hypothetical protein
MVKLAEHFTRDDAGRHPEWLRQREWFIKAKHDHQKRDMAEQRAEGGTGFATVALEIATKAQIASFEMKLNSHDEATVRALMENQDLLDAIQVQMDALLSQAYVTEDGRRVFRTADGTQVFDEAGTEVSKEELDPDLIDPSMPTWEAYAPLLQESHELEAEREAILAYQDKLDAVRDEIEQGGVTAEDLDAMDAELTELMPPSVAMQMPGNEINLGRANDPTTPRISKHSLSEVTGQIGSTTTPGLG